MICRRKRILYTRRLMLMAAIVLVVGGVFALALKPKANKGFMEPDAVYQIGVDLSAGLYKIEPCGSDKRHVYVIATGDPENPKLTTRQVKELEVVLLEEGQSLNLFNCEVSMLKDGDLSTF